MVMAPHSFASPSASGLFPTLKARLGLRVGATLDSMTEAFVAKCSEAMTASASARNAEQASVPLVGSDTAAMHFALAKDFPVCSEWFLERANVSALFPFAFAMSMA